MVDFKASNLQNSPLYEAKEKGSKAQAPPSNWQSSNGSVSTLSLVVLTGQHDVPTMAVGCSSVKLLDLYPDERSDTTLSCNDQVDVRAYKHVLATCCPYFKALFAGPWKESSEGSVVKIPFSSQVVKTVLNLFYAGIIDMDAVQQDPLQFIVFANKFDLPWLKEVAEKTCIEAIDEANLKDLWQAARMYDCDELKKRCVQYAIKYSHDVHSHEAMSSLKQEDPSSWEEFEMKFADEYALQAKPRRGVLFRRSYYHDSDEDSE